MAKSSSVEMLRLFLDSSSSAPVEKKQRKVSRSGLKIRSEATLLELNRSLNGQGVDRRGDHSQILEILLLIFLSFLTP